MARVVGAETLDHLEPDDPAAVRSRADLRRVHRVMGTRAIVAAALQGVLESRVEGRALRVLELGAGDGSLMLGVARSLATRPHAGARPRVELTLLDRQRLVSPATLAAYAALGWSAVEAVVDVADWAAGTSQAPCDLIVANLFLHHFEGAPLAALLVAVADRCDRFFACEPHRAWLALAGSHLIGAIGANAVTRHDAVLSVHAGFRSDELSAQWPGRRGEWALHEYSAGLFSHCFRAERVALR